MRKYQSLNEGRVCIKSVRRNGIVILQANNFPPIPPPLSRRLQKNKGNMNIGKKYRCEGLESKILVYSVFGEKGENLPYRYLLSISPLGNVCSGKSEL